MNNYEWLAAQKPNQLHLTRNDHACNYVTAKVWIEEYATQDEFKHVPPDLLEAMKATNTIWCLQIYPDTPIGSYVWYGHTIDSVIEQARKHFGNVQAHPEAG